MIVLYILLAIALLLVMVLIHEFGHYVAGRLLGFKIEEFSVGFGKAIISKINKRGERISLRLFPLGGYCAFAGEDDEKPNKDSFVSQPPWKRIVVFLAGVTFNFLTAIITSIIFLCAIGYDIPEFKGYDTPDAVIGLYEYDKKEDLWYDIKDENIPIAYRNDWNEILEKGDVIFAVEGTKIDFAYSKNYSDLITEQFAKLSAWINDDDETHTLDNFGSNGDGSVTFTIRRNGQYQDVQVPLIYSNLVHKDGSLVLDEKTQAPRHVMTISLLNTAYKHSFWEALSRCVSFAFGLAWIILKSLWQLITFQLPITQIGGTVTTIATIAGMTQQSASTIFALIPLLSANLAVFNALPFPALDGSHVVFALIEWIRGKPVNRKVENIIHTVGLAILFGFVIIVDILHFVL